MKKGEELEPLIYREDIAFKENVKKYPFVNYVDAFEKQLKELFLLDNLKYLGKDETLIHGSRDFKKYLHFKGKNYNYIYFPWNKTIVKCVEEKDYFRLKTNRNQDLITAKEQQALYNYKVAVFGMSVGSNIAFVLTQAGVSQNIIIADFDELDTTNLNRIWAGVHQVGLNKTVIAARRIYEDNPYAKVTALTEGITINKLHKFLDDRKIDCIVEEIDNMQLKIEIRKLAIKYKVPVLMITDNGDYAVLHIERYDLGYGKIFGENMSYWDNRMKNYKGKGDFADIVINKIVGGPDKVDPRMLLSAKKVIERKLISWPQLGSSALLGGVAVTVAIKEIIRKERELHFTRFYLNPLSEKS